MNNISFNHFQCDILSSRAYDIHAKLHNFNGRFRVNMLSSVFDINCRPRLYYFGILNEWKESFNLPCLKHMVGSVNKRPVFEKDRDDMLTKSDEGHVPYCEILMTSDSKKSQISSLNSLSLVRKGRKVRLHYLEERDEGALSKRILELSRTNQVRSAMELFRSIKVTRLQLNLHANNSLLSCLIRNDMLDLALEVFKTMNIRSGHSCSLVLKAVAISQGSNAALKLFWELERKSDVKKGFDAIVYNTMISICGKANDWVQMDKIWTTMKEHEHVGTTIIFGVLVCTFVRCGQYELAIDAYYEMLQHGLTPSKDIMQAIIGASTKEGKWDLALSVFQFMLKIGLKPNSVTFNALINSLGKAGKVKTAFEVYKHMKSLGHSPDTFTWNALLGALYRVNQHGTAIQLFDAISKDQSCKLNVNLYITVLLCCQRLCLWDKAVQLLWQMEESGVPVTTASYNLVISACEAARKPRIAVQVYKHMVYRKCVPDTFTRLSLIRCCIWGSLWSIVEEILGFLELERVHNDLDLVPIYFMLVCWDILLLTNSIKGINCLWARISLNNLVLCGMLECLIDHLPPNVSLYNAAIHGMCLQGETKSAKRLYMKMQEIGLVPDGKTRALMLQHLQKY